MRSGLRRLRARSGGELRYGDDGFTIIEMVVALSILAVALLSLAYGIFGGMTVLQAGRHQTSFLELANAEAEAIRALSYAEAGVNSNDPALVPVVNPNAHYVYSGVDSLGRPVYKFDGRDAVVIDPPVAATPRAVQVVTTSPVSSRPVPYTIKRWITWTDPTGGTARRFKRIDVAIEWKEPNGRARSVRYNTLYYPGGLGAVRIPPPVASVTASPTSGFAGSTSFSFTGTATDPSGLAITSYAWNLGDLLTPSGPTVSRTFPTVGRKTVSLVVTNSAGVESVPVTADVLVGTAPGTPAPPGNVAPVAAFTATPTSGEGPLSVSVDAAASSDANGDPLTYVWTWGDATPNGDGSASGHTYTSVGTYRLTLTVRDPAGASSSASTPITVNSLTCAVSSASFKNPGTNATLNDIRLGDNDEPVNTQFVFEAVTNPSCTGVNVQLPTQTSAFTATLALVASTSTSKTWQVMATDSSKYNTGASQSGTFSATGSAGAVPFTIRFAVHA